MKLVDRTIDIEADPTTVYEHFVDADRFVQWMAPEAQIDPQPGGVIRWTHHNGDSCEGRFVELVPGRRIVFTYGWDRPDIEVPPGSTTVEITLAPTADGTRLHLIHRGLADPMADAHDGGWANYLARLAAAAAGRDPGPDPLAGERAPSAASLGLGDGRGVGQSGGATPQADIDIDIALVRSLLVDQHADVAHLPLHREMSGWDNIVIRLGDDLAVRLPRRQVAAALLENEQRWLPVLAPRLPLAVPTPVRIGRPALGFPWAWSIVPWIDGEDAVTSPPADARAAAEALGKFLGALHQPAPGDAPANPFRGIALADRSEITTQHLEAVDDLVDTAPIREAWQSALDLEPFGGEPVWLHGDLHPANVVVRAGAIVGVIDFGDLTSGDPATDLAVAWTLLPRAHHDAFRSAVGGVDDTTWRRARAWALALAVAGLAHAADAPTLAATSRRRIDAVLADLD